MSWSTVAAIAVTVYATSTILHELGHAVASLAVGGDPTLVTSTDVRIDLSAVSSVGYLTIGLAGSAVNWSLAGLGLGLLAAGSRRAASGRFFAWLLLAVNGFIPSVYMVISPVFGIGDWNTMLGQLPADPVWRGMVALVGAGLAFWWVGVAAGRLRDVLPGLGTGSRSELARRMVAASWAAGGAVGIAAGALSPIDTGWGLLIGAGSTLGTTWPLFPTLDRARSTLSEGSAGPAPGIERSPAWLVVGVVTGGVFVLVFGPGLRI